MNLSDLYNKQRKLGNLRSNSSSGVNSTKKLPQEIIALFVALFVSCALVHYVAVPLFRETRIIKAVNEIKKNDIKAGQFLLLRMQKINEENEKFNINEIEKIKSFIPNRNNYEDYLARIVELANLKNIYLDELSVIESDNQEQQDVALNEKKINIVASGSFPNVLSFIQNLEKGIPFVQEEAISVSVVESPGNETREPILNYEINLKFYHY